MKVEVPNKMYVTHIYPSTIFRLEEVLKGSSIEDDVKEMRDYCGRGQDARRGILLSGTSAWKKPLRKAWKLGILNKSQGKSLIKGKKSRFR